jgi:uncharacterized repeat protein (TIGR01451 family)
VRTHLTRRVLAGVTSLAIGGVFVVASGLAAVADSPDINSTAVADYKVLPNGTVEVTVQGNWAWPSHKTDCNQDRYAAGWAVAWNDAAAPGNFVGTLNGVDYYVGTPTDNTVHYYPNAPRCGAYNGAFNTGSWGPETHTYANVKSVPAHICVVTYDIHTAGKNGGIKDGDLNAGGRDRNGDNSVESNGQRSTCADIVIKTPKPDVAIVKTASPTSVQVGQKLDYNLAVTNAGDDPTDQTVTVNDTVPAGLRLDSVTADSGWSCTTAGQTVNCTFPGVMAAHSSPTNIKVHTTALAAGVPSVFNSATVNTPDDSNPNNNESHVTVPVTTLPAPDVAIKKSATPSVVVGDDITYTLSVSNASTEDTDKTITVTDVLPSTVTFKSVTPGAGWTCSSAQSFTCTYDKVIKPGKFAPDIKVIATALAGAVPSVTNIANVNTPDDSNPNNNQDDATTVVTLSPVPDVTITKTATPQVKVGDTITYSLIVTNDSKVATDKTLTVTDAVPTSVQVTNVTGGNGWQCSGTQNVSCTYAAALAPGASAPAITVTGTALPGAAPSVVNTGRVSNPDDANPNNNDDSATTVVNAPQPNLSLTKSATPADGSTVERGERIDYMLSYSNTGDADATTADISDVVPASTTYVAGSASCGGTCTASYDAASNTVHWSLAIPAHSNGAVSFSVTVDNDAVDGTVIKNVGQLTSGTHKVPSNTVQHLVFVPSGDLRLHKSVDKDSAKAGDTLNYTLVAKATGTMVQHDVVVTDEVPDGTTFVSADCASPCTASYSAGLVTWELGDMQPGDSQSMTFAVSVDGPDADGTLPTEIPNVGHVKSTDTPRTPSNRVVVPITTVLGNKIVKTPPVTTLPFTGLPLVQDILLAMVLIGGGVLLLTWPRLRSLRVSQAV